MSRKDNWRYEKREKKKDRDFLSYEDYPLEDYEEVTPKVSKKNIKRVIKCFIILILCTLVVLAIVNRKKLTYDNIYNWFNYQLLGKDEGEGYPTSIIGTNLSEGNFFTIDNYLLYASDTSYVSLTTNAHQIFNKQLSYSKPIVSPCEDKVIIYNLGNTGFQINTVNKNLYTGDAPDKIITADISKSGDYSIVTRAKGYLSKLYVYNKDNTEKYTYSFADYYINNVAISPSSNGGIVSGVSSEDGVMTSAIYILDFKSEKPKKVLKYNNNLIYDIKYLSNNMIVAVGRNSSYLINLSDDKVKEKDYNKGVLTCYDVNTATGCYVLSLSRSGDGRACDILYFNSVGDEVSKISTDLEISSISLYKDKIAILSNSESYIYNKLGEQIYSGNPGSDGRQIKLYSETSAYILGINEIRQLDFTKQTEVEQSDT